MREQDWLKLSAIHKRIRKAELPGYALHYGEGADVFWMEIYLDNGASRVSREHSFGILMEWADETLRSVGA